MQGAHFYSSWEEEFTSQRRQALAKSPNLTGIDFVTVIRNARGKITGLKVYFIPKILESNPVITIPPNIKKENIKFTPGQSERSIPILLKELKASPQEENALLLNLTEEEASKLEEFNNYTLYIENIDSLDPVFNKAKFYTSSVELQNPFPELEETNVALKNASFGINYLCKDYASFRQLMLDRLTFLQPGIEYNIADLEIVLIELLAHIADQVSYYQDAVATEAYLGTARQRISVRRHARLLGYNMHEGCNSRVWIHLQLAGNTPSYKEGIQLKKGTQFLTHVPGFPTVLNCLTEDQQLYDQMLTYAPACFESLYDINLYPNHNQFQFYSWGAPNFKLKKGATNATLQGHFENLKVGDVLIFKEVLNPTTGKEEGINPDHVHPVRIKNLKKTHDCLSASKPITEIEWYTQDCLPFDLVVAALIDENRTIVSIALGNIVLADHGRTVEEVVGPPASKLAHQKGLKLNTTNLIFREPFDVKQSQRKPAKLSYKQALKLSCPALKLFTLDDYFQEEWVAQPDLLESRSWETHFVVEVDNNHQPWLRFGDDKYGKRPVVSQFKTQYRVGNYEQGHIGAQSIKHIVLHANNNKGATKFCEQGGILEACNPLAARGGIRPQSIQEVKLQAPYFMRARQERVVTEEDYIERVNKHPDVKEAAASLMWIRNLPCMHIAIRRIGDLPLDETFKDDLYSYLDSFRLLGQDIHISGPKYISLDMSLPVLIDSSYPPENIKNALMEKFSSSVIKGVKGFFHPENFAFGQNVYLDSILMNIASIPGVLTVDLTRNKNLPYAPRFQRLSQPSTDAIDKGYIKIGKLEIARLENDSFLPEKGKLTFHLKAGNNECR